MLERVEDRGTVSVRWWMMEVWMKLGKPRYLFRNLVKRELREQRLRPWRAIHEGRNER